MNSVANYSGVTTEPNNLIVNPGLRDAANGAKRRTPTGTLTNTATPEGSSTHTPTPSPSPTTAGAETTAILQEGSNGYSGGEDTYVYKYGPDGGYCMLNAFQIGYKQWYAGLVRFDVSPIPRDAAITRAVLQLYATGWGGGNTTIGAYYITRTVTLCQATWYQAQSGNAWGQPGANDLVSDRRPSAESTVTTSGVSRWYDWDLTAVGQGWVNGSLANNGVLLRAAYDLSSFYFASAQHATAPWHLKLVITYRH